MSFLRGLCSVIGAAVLLMWLLAPFFDWNFRMCYGPKETCALTTEAK